MPALRETLQMTWANKTSTAKLRDVAASADVTRE